MDALVVGPGADYRYLAGYDAHESERLTALVVFQDGGEIIFVPAWRHLALRVVESRS